ncbi:protein C19orf12 homolog [Sturnira hondurensis]|uniref:protein C19orf12 homolog n=1 Tax=Sturnira hondurensis TaxID=192404 RepID=UPI00187B0BF1|nr:protein C19orf12 homolog [Sturnira hondurensis]XP_036922312.1 protein C19orf12 homolog [Sturnira hondurensis]XP_036922313.1 protein C19orf12 homolog [Sturnira hondurensis]
MPVSKRDVMNLLCSISDWRGLQVVSRGRWKGIMNTAVCTGLGNFLAGPPGMVVGGVFGGLLGVWMAKEKRTPMSQVLKGLPGDQQQKLFNKVKAIISNLHSMNDTQLMMCVMSSECLQQQLVDMLMDFFAKELKIRSEMQK